MSNEVTDNWDSHWGSYSDAATSNPAQHFRFRMIRSLVKNSLDETPSNLLVDVGCGNGDFLRYASQTMKDVKILGIEPSTTGSIIAAEKVGQLNIRRLDLVHSEPSDTEDIRAGIVVCSEVLEHLDHPLQLLVGIRKKIAVSGTRLIVSVPGGPRSAYDRHIGHRPHFTKHRLEALLYAAGFGQVKVMRSGFPFFNVYKLAVIVLGDRIIARPAQFTGQSGRASKVLPIVTKLMNACPRDFPFGWQLFATATV